MSDSTLLLLILGMMLSTGSALAEPGPTYPPPDDVAPLVKAGQVELEFYDPVREPQRFPGHTRFQFEFEYRYEFKGRVQGADDEAELLIEPQVQVGEVKVRHTIRLPRAYAAGDPWKTPLVRHELDHVAVSTDPRAKLLQVYLFRELRSLRVVAPADGKADEETMRKAIETELDARQRAIDALVQANYDRLDKVSSHGDQPLPDRKAFFARLYTKANLDETEFPYTGDVLDLLRSDEYRDESDGD